jgi:polysaccharide export outer membrane protein
MKGRHDVFRGETTMKFPLSLSALRGRQVALALAFALLSSPSFADDAPSSAATQVNAPANIPGGNGGAGVVNDPNYRLGAGDRVRVTVFGQPDLSGIFQIDGTGKVALPLVGNVNAGGLSASDFEKSIVGALKPDYLQDPRVSVEVMTYRPFYIVGEVKNPGNYPYTNGMTVINAVAMAGGFTYRAKDDDFEIKRAGKNSKETEDATQETLVHPGDVITVPERWF